MLNNTIRHHFTFGYGTLFGIQVRALECKHCKEVLLCGTERTTNPKYKMHRHFAEEHPLLNRIYN